MGFNYGLGPRYPILTYFDHPTERQLRRVVAGMRRARSLGANTLRVYLEIRAFMRGPHQTNPRALAALAALLDEAEQLHVYLDLTGNLVWRAPPAWYDVLPEHARWAVQARFWRAVARTAQGSPAVLVYELTSEPVIADAQDWYCGAMDGYTFIQRIVRETSGRDPAQPARRWIRLLTRSIRRYDRRHLRAARGRPPDGGHARQIRPATDHRARLLPVGRRRADQRNRRHRDRLPRPTNSTAGPPDVAGEAGRSVVPVHCPRTVEAHALRLNT